MRGTQCQFVALTATFATKAASPIVAATAATVTATSTETTKAATTVVASATSAITALPREKNNP